MNSISAEILLALMVAFCLKHWVADFVLQTARMVQEKGQYGKLGGLMHSGIHAFCTFFVLLVFALPLPFVLMIILIEFVVHYHIDYAKEGLSRWLGDTTSAHRYWVVLGFDQLLHHLTYAVIIYAVI